MINTTIGGCTWQVVRVTRLVPADVDNKNYLQQRMCNNQFYCKTVQEYFQRLPKIKEHNNAHYLHINKKFCDKKSAV